MTMKYMPCHSNAHVCQRMWVENLSIPSSNLTHREYSTVVTDYMFCKRAVGTPFHKPQIKIFNFEISILKKMSGDENMERIMFSRWLKWSNLFPKLFCGDVLWGIFYHPQVFLKIVKNCISTHLFHWPQITMGWVLMIRKVLPSKSMNSEEYFEYPSYCHIFNRSEVTPSFQ